MPIRILSSLASQTLTLHCAFNSFRINTCRHQSILNFNAAIVILNSWISARAQYPAKHDHTY